MGTETGNEESLDIDFESNIEVRNQANCMPNKA